MEGRQEATPQRVPLLGTLLAWFSLPLSLRIPGRKEAEGPREEEAVPVKQRAHRRG